MKRLCAALVIGLFFTTQLPITALATHIATTTDGVDVTLTVTEAAAPTPPPPSGGGGPPGTPETILILNVTPIVGTSTAIVSWETNKPALSTFSWGQTAEHASGTIAGVVEETFFSAFLDDLIPETQYFFRIEATDNTTGTQAYVGNFTTARLPDIKPPANLTNFTATSGEDYIDLTWDNPPDPDFTQVRIVRSETFYPAHPFDGIVVYEGPGEFVRDRDVVAGVTYYYAAFARDQVNYSEGALARGRLLVAGEPPEILPPIPEFPPAPEVPPALRDLSLLDFDFIQDGKKIPHFGLSVPIDGSKDLTISTEYENLPEVLKTIAFTLVDPEDPRKTFSFLLRVTPEKETFQTTIAPLLRGGTYDMFINILDHKNQELRKINGELLATAVAALPIEHADVFLDCLIALIVLVGVLFFVALWRSVRYGPLLTRTLVISVLLPVLLYLAFWRDEWVEMYSCTILVVVIIGLVVTALLRMLTSYTRRKRQTANQENENNNVLNQTR